MPCLRRLHVGVSIGRVFAVTERYRREARLEAFNAVNHTNFNLSKTSTVGVTDSHAVTSPVFGRLTAVKDPRVLQLASKMYC